MEMPKGCGVCLFSLCSKGCAMARNEIERLQTENAELRKDAARYWWLRDVGYGFDIAVREEDEDGEQWVHGYPPEELDAAIDAAMKGGE